MIKLLPPTTLAGMLLALPLSCLCAVRLDATPPAGPAMPTAPDDKVPLVLKVENGIAWHDPVSWGVEGRGWTEGLDRFYDRLPARAQKTVPGGVWYFSHESAGMSVRFVTDAGSIHVRYRLSSPDLSHGWADVANMSASGVDLYALTPDAASGKDVWRWVGGNKPAAQSGSDCLVNGLAPGRRPYQLNLPAYNGVESIEIGVPVGATFEPLPPRTDLPIVFYGTSIMQGGVASRPGLAIPALVGRRLDCPVINFGFCGSGCMDAPVVDLLAEIHAAAYVIDCGPNMTAEQISQRTEPLVRRLRQAHSDTPILLVENHDYPTPELFPGEKADIEARQAALHAVYDRLIKEGDPHLHYLPGGALIGDDSEGTGDGIHPNALGMFRYGEAYTAALKTILKPATCDQPQDQLIASPGRETYYVDPVRGDDGRTGKAKDLAWKSLARVNALRLAPGDKVIIGPGVHGETLKPSGAGTAGNPVVIRFQPGVHEFAVANALRRPYFVSNSCDDPKMPKPVGVLLENVAHFRVEGGGVEGSGKTGILYGGRMIEIVNDRAEDIVYSGLVFDLKRPTVSEFRVLEGGPHRAVIQIAEGSDYGIENGKFRWTGDWGTGGLGCQEAVVEEGTCHRIKTPRGWNEKGQSLATATDLGGRKIQLDYGNEESGLILGRQYQFRLQSRDSVGVHNTRSKNIIFRDCDFYALTNMGLVSQFTENITYQRVNVAPPAGTLRTCAAWADIFQFSNCKGEVLVEGCRLSGMQDDAVNCHGTHLRIIEKPADNQLLVRFMQPQTYGFAAYAPGDEVAVINHSELREYDNNPRRKVSKVEARSEKDWLLTLDGPVPSHGPDDVLDNITWHPNLTLRNNHVSMDPVRGFLITTRGKALVEGNTFLRCAMPGILVEDDAEGWFESGPVRDLLIRNNRFIRCGIEINPHTATAKPEEPVHENIRIEGNFFDECGVSAKAVKGLTVAGNRFSASSLPVRTSSCTEVKTEGNPLGVTE